MNYKINEIFKSLQGEGVNTGREVTFIRLSGCNLSCPWCDTDHSEQMELDEDQILKVVLDFGTDSVILTGGEPTIWNLDPLKQKLKAAGLWVAIETNGTRKVSGFDYIAVSPKSMDSIQIESADEVRVVYPGSFTKTEIISLTAKIKAKYYMLSPLYSNGFQLEPCIKLLGDINKCNTIKWFLSIQTHKLLGIR